MTDEPVMQQNNSVLSSQPKEKPEEVQAEQIPNEETVPVIEAPVEQPISEEPVFGETPTEQPIAEEAAPITEAPVEQQVETPAEPAPVEQLVTEQSVESPNDNPVEPAPIAEEAAPITEAPVEQPVDIPAPITAEQPEPQPEEKAEDFPTRSETFQESIDEMKEEATAQEEQNSPETQTEPIKQSEGIALSPNILADEESRLQQDISQKEGVETQTVNTDSENENAQSVLAPINNTEPDKITEETHPHHFCGQNFNCMRKEFIFGLFIGLVIGFIGMKIISLLL